MFKLLTMHAHILMAIFAAILFYALIPGVLVSAPPNGTQAQQNMVHAVVYALFFFFFELSWLRFS